MAVRLMLYQLSAYCLSDIGLVRHNNEDAWKMLKNEQFFVLADGMGGHQAGEVASKEAVDQLCDLFQEHIEDFYQDITQAMLALKEIIQEVNEAIYRLGKGNPAFRGMGTTLCSLFFHQNGLIYAHVGDSRIYRYRHEHLEQLTQDHSLLRELIDLGQMSEQQAGDFVYKNIITKAIGTELHVEPTIHRTSIEVGDLFLMCSDGLSDLVCFEEIQKILAHHSEEESLRQLVEKAKQNGGYDNITMMLVKVQQSHANPDATHLS